MPVGGGRREGAEGGEALAKRVPIDPEQAGRLELIARRELEGLAQQRHFHPRHHRSVETAAFRRGGILHDRREEGVQQPVELFAVSTEVHAPLLSSRLPVEASLSALASASCSGGTWRLWLGRRAVSTTPATVHCGLASLRLLLLRAPPGGPLVRSPLRRCRTEQGLCLDIDSIKSACWLEDGSTALQGCPRRAQPRLRLERRRCWELAYGVGRKEPCALPPRPPSGMRTQVWLCRPRRPDSVRWNSVFAVARSRPKVVITVRMMARVISVRGRASREPWIASNP